MWKKEFRLLWPWYFNVKVIGISTGSACHHAGFVCLCFQCWMKMCTVVENFLLNFELQLYLCITITVIFFICHHLHYLWDSGCQGNCVNGSWWCHKCHPLIVHSDLWSNQGPFSAVSNWTSWLTIHHVRYWLWQEFLFITHSFIQKSALLTCLTLSQWHRFPC